MKINIKNVAVDVAVGALNIVANATQENDTQTINLDVSSDKITASTSIEIKADKPA